VAREGGHESIAQMIDVCVFSVSPLLEMPWDALLHVLSFLEPFDLCSLAQVCSVLRQLSPRPVHGALLPDVLRLLLLVNVTEGL